MRRSVTLPAPPQGVPEAFAEAHYFDRGLRTKPVGRDDRPAWAAAPDRVGFRGEFVLGDNDLAIEYFRLRHARRPLTWLGLYGRSSDKTHGDRQNYAGLGIWILDGRIVDPAALLRDLRKLVGLANPEQLSILDANARSFSTDYLPRYLAPRPVVPDELGGWPFAPGAAPDTALFVARPADGPEAWRDVANRIFAIELLPDGHHSRAVILVPERPAADVRANGDAQKLEQDGGLRLAREIPPLFATLGERLTQQSDEMASLRSEIADLQARLDDATAEIAQSRAASLQKVNAEPSVDVPAQIAALDGRVRTLQATCEDILRMIRRDQPIPFHAPKASESGNGFHYDQDSSNAAHGLAALRTLRAAPAEHPSVFEWIKQCWAEILLTLAILALVSAIVFFAIRWLRP